MSAAFPPGSAPLCTPAAPWRRGAVGGREGRRACGHLLVSVSEMVLVLVLVLLDVGVGAGFGVGEGWRGVGSWSWCGLVLGCVFWSTRIRPPAVGRLFAH